MSIQEGLTIGAVLLSPLVALSVERWRRKADARAEREREILFDLVRARAATRSPEQMPESKEIMERALNAIPVVFSRSARITAAYRIFYDTMGGTATQAIKTQKLVDLLLAICRELGYREVEESTLKNILLLGRDP